MKTRENVFQAQEKSCASFSIILVDFFFSDLNEFIPLVGKAAGFQNLADIGKDKNKTSAESGESNSEIFGTILDALEAAVNRATDVFESVNSALLRTAVNVSQYLYKNAAFLSFIFFKHPQLLGIDDLLSFVIFLHPAND